MSNTPVSSDKKRIMVTLPKDLGFQMEAKAKELGLTKSGLVALALRNLFDGELGIQEKSN